MKTNTLAVHAKLLGCCRLFNYAPMICMCIERARAQSSAVAISPANLALRFAMLNVYVCKGLIKPSSFRACKGIKKFFRRLLAAWVIGITITNPVNRL